MHRLCDAVEWMEKKMNVIEYRFWNKDDMIMASDRSTMNEESINKSFLEMQKHYIAMRYINVNDKNGKKIFQKDICKYYNKVDKDGIGIIEDDYIKWISGTIAKTNLMTPLYYLKCGTELEVIGNVYENTNLIEASK